MRSTLLLCGALLAASAPHAVAPLEPASAAAARCPAQILELPAPPGATSTTLKAMNNGGWVAGTADVDGEGRIVLWRNGRAPLDLGKESWKPRPGKKQFREPFDVNDNNVIALMQGKQNFNRHLFSWVLTGMSGLLWHHGSTTRLKGTPDRPWAWVTAINDHGTAVGYITDGYPSHRFAIPVVWRHGTLERLPLPPSASQRLGGGQAYEINNHGLIVGSVGKGAGRAWWWRLGGGHGPLRKLGDQTIRAAYFVDDSGQIVGRQPGYAGWPDPTAPPRRLDVRFEISSMTTDGAYYTGRAFADRGGEEDTHVRIGRTSHRRQARLPFLPDSNTSYGVPSVGRGVTAYATQGGVTVGGTLAREDQPGQGLTDQRAVLWTCAQTYLP
jgi:hypothetical protein